MIMRNRVVKGAVIAAFVTLGSSVPANAVGLADLAKVVLGGKSVLKKAETKCGAPAALSLQENSAISLAVEAARKALPQSQFLALDSASETAATKASTSTTFCPETATKKKGLLQKIGGAGKKLIGAKILGL
jgi:hypothetical protein